WGIVIQAYLRDSAADIKALCEFAKARGTPFTVRLVKGAYWDYETIHADQLGWPIPVFLNKKESDANFEHCATLLLESHPHIRLAAGTHNVRSIAATAVKAKQLGVDPKAIEFQMLYGMADPIKKSMLKLGYRVREYTTVGELIPGMAYLVRRLLENTSNESFLRSKFADKVATDVLLANPAADLQTSPSERTKPTDVFLNAPPLDWTKKDNHERIKAALNSVKAKLPFKVRPIVNGKDMP